MKSSGRNCRISNRNHTGFGNGNNIINGGRQSMSGDSIRRVLVNKKRFNKSSQTMLSFPSPYGNSNIFKHASNTGVSFATFY